VGKPIPSGKSIVFIGSAPVSPQGLTFAKELQAAGKVLGWNVKSIQPAGADTSALQSAFDQALALKPDALAILGQAPGPISRQLQKAKQENIPVFAAAVAADEGAPLTGIVGATGSSEFDIRRQQGSGEFVGLQAPEGSQVGIGVLQGFSGTQKTIAEVTAGVKKTCPTCTAKPIQIAPTQIPDAPKILANAARSNPKMKWIVLTLDSVMGKGLGAALKGAGATDVKYGGTAAIEDGVERVRTGQESWVEVYPISENAWLMTDMMARHFAGVSLAPSVAGGSKPWFITKDNVPAQNTFPDVVDYQKQFTSLWGK
jgi:ribose transport system substrate-binding protein